MFDKKEYKKEYYKENREKILEKQNEYYKENRERILEYKKEYKKENRERILEYQRNRYRSKHIESIEIKEKYKEQTKGNIVYFYTDLNNNIVYIGSSKNLRHRLSSRNNKSSKSYFDNIYQKYPEQFKLYILGKFDTIEEARAIEKLLIAIYIPKYNIYVNKDMCKLNPKNVILTIDKIEEFDQFLKENEPILIPSLQELKQDYEQNKIKIIGKDTIKNKNKVDNKLF